jgi:DNA polymerase I
MANLFDLIEDTHDVSNDGWRPQPLPSLDGIHEIELDCETTGLKWWESDRPIGFGLCLPDGSTRYIPWGHRGLGNLDEEMVKRWCHRELRGKHITNLNTRFDVHMLRAWGVDLEAQGCTVSDVGHFAALLDDHRLHLSLESLCQDFLPDERKVKSVEGTTLDTSRMSSYSAGTIAVRAEADVRQVHKLKHLLLPKLAAEDLMRVKDLEDKIIYVVCEMEKNGAIIDQQLLDEWIRTSQIEMDRCLLELAKMVHFQVNPASSKDVERLFKHLKIPITEFTDKGAPSFSDTVIKQLEHPAIKLMRHAKKLFSIRSKFLLKYQKSLDSHGVLRFALHQLRATRGEGDEEGETGTISGRFSSTEIVSGIGVNIQQIMKAEKQVLTHGDEYLIRQLHVPASGLFLSADAAQIEYRLFAHEASNPKVLAAYKKDPNISFHKMVWGMLKPFKADLSYKRTKDINFASIYGAGLTKIALMFEFITKKEFWELRESKATGSHPKLSQTAEIRRIYDREIPEAKRLLKSYSEQAVNKGFITTLLGRRMRFINGARAHKALNGRIQGSAADIMKLKLVSVHQARKDTGLLLRATIHDEIIGDVPDVESAQKVAQILNQQSLQLKVPILWETETGTSWLDCSREAVEEARGQL